MSLQKAIDHMLHEIFAAVIKCKNYSLSPELEERLQLAREDMYVAMAGFEKVLKKIEEVHGKEGI